MERNIETWSVRTSSAAFIGTQKMVPPQHVVKFSEAVELLIDVPENLSLVPRLPGGYGGPCSHRELLGDYGALRCHVGEGIVGDLLEEVVASGGDLHRCRSYRFYLRVPSCKPTAT